MNVSLTPEFDAYIEGKVKSGSYNSASEVVREALRLLRERDALQEVRLEELRKQVREGFAQVDRGDYLEFSSTEDLTSHITNEGRKRSTSTDNK